MNINEFVESLNRQLKIAQENFTVIKRDLETACDIMDDLNKRIIKLEIETGITNEQQIISSD